MTEALRKGALRMAQPIKHKKGSHLVAKTLALFFSALLIFCLLIPIQRARVNTKQEYRDLFQYTRTAKKYYYALHGALSNLNSIHTALTPAVQSQSATTVAFSALRAESELLSIQRSLAALAADTRYSLLIIPDPGNSGIVDAVNASYSAYLAYANCLLSGEYDSASFQETLRETKAEAYAQKNRLYQLLFEQ